MVEIMAGILTVSVPATTPLSEVFGLGVAESRVRRRCHFSHCVSVGETLSECIEGTQCEEWHLTGEAI
jgi:hypothetical protein